MADSDKNDASAGNDAPLMIEGPKAEQANEPPTIDIELLPPPHDSDSDSVSGEAEPAETVEQDHAGWTLPSYAPLAAGVALAIVVGALAGSAATMGLMRDAPSSTTVAAIDTNRALQESVTQLSTDLAMLKTGIVTAQKTASTQFGKLAERLDRAEKAQAEPSAKLAKIQESLDKLDHRQQVAAVTPPSPTAPGTASPEVTGTIAPKEANGVKDPKEESRPPVAEGWKLRDYHAGRVLVQSRNGTLFEVGPGANLPGLGRVEQIKRENGQIVVVAQNGTISGPPLQRRPTYYLPPPLYR